MKLTPFDQRHAARVLGWAQSPRELSFWASLTESPPIAIFEKWLTDADTFGHLLVLDDPIAYGETWVSEPEDEVELAHVLVDPGHRNRGMGRRFVELLVADASRLAVSTAWVRVVPENEPAIRCYRSAGFEMAPADRQAELNAPQPRAYRWLSRRL